jgi:hypothetical protein
LIGSRSREFRRLPFEDQARHILSLMQTRRAALLTIAGAAASPILLPKSLFAQHEAHAMGAAAAPLESYDPVFFKKPDFAVISKLADLILPRTETPGAVDVHVPFRIDHEVAGSPELQKSFETGLALLQAEALNAGAENFTSLSESQQTAILTSMSSDAASPQGQFFQTMKGLTVDWYYRSEEGLVQELGFHGNTFRAEFPGCTHPEHWPVQESR